MLRFLSFLISLLKLRTTSLLLPPSCKLSRKKTLSSRPKLLPLKQSLSLSKPTLILCWLIQSQSRLTTSLSKKISKCQKTSSSKKRWLLISRTMTTRDRNEPDFYVVV